MAVLWIELTCPLPTPNVHFHGRSRGATAIAKPWSASTWKFRPTCGKTWWHIG